MRWRKSPLREIKKLLHLFVRVICKKNTIILLIYKIHCISINILKRNVFDSVFRESFSECRCIRVSIHPCEKRTVTLIVRENNQITFLNQRCNIQNRDKIFIAG